MSSGWIVVVLALVVSLFAGVDACSMPEGWRPLTDVEEILNAEEVLYGEVWRTFPDDSGTAGRENLYTAEVEVFCILKGRQSSHILNITDVGLSSLLRIYPRQPFSETVVIAFFISYLNPLVLLELRV